MIKQANLLMLFDESLHRQLYFDSQLTFYIFLWYCLLHNLSVLCYKTTIILILCKNFKIGNHVFCNSAAHVVFTLFYSLKEYTSMATSFN